MNKATTPKSGIQEFSRRLEALPRGVGAKFADGALELADLADELLATNPPEEAVRQFKAELDRRRAERRRPRMDERGFGIV